MPNVSEFQPVRISLIVAISYVGSARAGLERPANSRPAKADRTTVSSCSRIGVFFIPEHMAAGLVAQAPGAICRRILNYGYTFTKPLF
jgi:hypothetical protein